MRSRKPGNRSLCRGAIRLFESRADVGSGGTGSIALICGQGFGYTDRIRWKPPKRSDPQKFLNSLACTPFDLPRP